MEPHVVKHFKTVDPLLAAAIKPGFAYTLKRSHDHFTGLCRIIIGQQVSTKAAQSIFAKFTARFRDGIPTPRKLARLSDETLRAAGLSGSKVRSIRDLADHIARKQVDLRAIDVLDNEQIAEMLLPVKGIGPWSVEMFLLFYLGREDVFSPGDLGLRNAIMRIYNLDEVPTKEAMAALSERWKPYRSYACRILWESLNSNPDLEIVAEVKTKKYRSAL